MIPLLALLAFPPGHLVQLNTDQIYAWSLPASVDDKYRIYSFNEAKDLKIGELQLSQFAQENALFNSKLKEDDVLISSLKLEVDTLKNTNGILKEESDRRFKEYTDCSVALKDEQSSVFPVIALSVGGTALVTGIVLIAIATH